MIDSEVELSGNNSGMETMVDFPIETLRGKFPALALTDRDRRRSSTCQRALVPNPVRKAVRLSQSSSQR
ncbi:hypothetical protein FJ428_24690 [Mesorhizobium sp. B2-8-1]|nr:hypothetical protein FJW11_01060 [Mesorhizobium sp. B3-1-1]TPI97925.1 hypothetical protein FJ428_24690 [Mesorhizobium sp. B2-8-1]TPJ71693.1 hypothetical protein FJ462_03780 [Mesorhizobium sp. B2-6-7]TPJ89189.1 hypothetical protein FJ422_04820 [Mesorhizobium sp. B2-6-3]TPK04270.1 hypothetical protein FJ491_04820 [Mesorhizobium sp. B2-5-10]TPK14710.1 hypothetical protein FJ490_05215 [Mesorhizobium sp. B2-5-11]TPK37352.1 hypothetical protein FJ885_04820 [Mesorhizobium sp. B2-5-8]